MSEIDRRIQSPELAEHMAYAEKPFMDIASLALRTGVVLDADLKFHAHNAGIQAARSYIKGLNDTIDSWGPNERENKEEPTIYDSLLSFAKQRGYSHVLAGRAYWCLRDAIYHNPDLEVETQATFTLDGEYRELTNFRITRGLIEAAVSAGQPYVGGRSFGKRSRMLIEDYVNSTS